MNADLQQSEKAIVGAILEKPELAFELNASWFDDLRLGAIVACAIEMQTAGKPVDIVTIAGMSKKPDTLGILQDCQNLCHSTSNFCYWRDIIQAAYERRRLGGLVGHFLAKLPESNGNLPSLISELESGLAVPILNRKQTMTAKAAADALNENIEASFNLRGQMSGLATGFQRLDRITNGLQFGELTVLAARPSIGKTAIGMNFVKRICLDDGNPTLILSMEMSAASLGRRLLSAYTHLDMGTLKSGNLSDDDMKKITVFNSVYRKSKIFIHESTGGVGAGEAASIIRRMTKKHGIKFVLIDYLQKIKPDKSHEKRTYEIGASAETIRNSIVEAKVACVCLAQLNREADKDKGRMPKLSDLADSGSIEREADNVLLLHRDKTEDDHNAKLLISKQRDGETGLVDLYFDGRFCRFTELDKTIDPSDVPRNPYTE